MSKKPREDQNETFGESYERTCRDAERGIEESGKRFQKEMSRKDNED